MFACRTNPSLPMQLDRQPVGGEGVRVEGA